MNLWTVLGIVLIGVGTLVMVWGQSKQSRNDSRAIEERIEGVRREVSAARMQPESTRKAALDSIESGFRSWADDLVKHRASKELAVQEQGVTSLRVQLETSRPIAPIWSEVIEAIRMSCRAYAARTGKAIGVELPNLPENLFGAMGRSSYSGKVSFSPTCEWQFSTLAISGLGGDEPHLFIHLIDPTDPTSRSEGNYVRLDVDVRNSTVDFAIHGPRFPRPTGSVSNISFAKGMEPIVRASQQLLERQLLEINR